MDPARTPLGKMLLDEITPVVMVLSTPLVEESCQKNGLSLAEMLSPYCTFNNIDGNLLRNSTSLRFKVDYGCVFNHVGVFCSAC